MKGPTSQVHQQKYLEHPLAEDIIFSGIGMWRSLSIAFERADDNHCALDRTTRLLASPTAAPRARRGTLSHASVHVSTLPNQNL